MSKTLLILMLLCRAVYGSAQNCQLTYNPDLITEKITVSDTFYHTFTDATGKEVQCVYPQNSNILWLENADSLLLGSIRAQYIHDTLITTLSKISTSLNIVLQVRITKQLTCEAKITYWTPELNPEIELEIKTCHLEINLSSFHKNQSLMGKIELHTSSPLSNQDRFISPIAQTESQEAATYPDVPVQISGNFNVVTE